MDLSTGAVRPSTVAGSGRLGMDPLIGVHSRDSGATNAITSPIAVSTPA